jgi:hypothetical protein
MGRHSGLSERFEDLGEVTGVFNRAAAVIRTHRIASACQKRSSRVPKAVTVRSGEVLGSLCQHTVHGATVLMCSCSSSGTKAITSLKCPQSKDSV